MRGAPLLAAFAVALAALAVRAAAAPVAAPPPTPVEPVVETHHGVAVTDPYRWLEDTSAPATVAWLRAQDAHARAVLAALPGHAGLRERLAALDAADVRVKDADWAGDRLFYLKRAPGDETYKLYVRDGIASPERLLVDPDAFARPDAPAAIDYFRAAPNGARVAFGVSLGGSEDATLHVIDVATRAAIGAPIPRARWASPSFRFDGNVLFYTQQKDAPAGAPAADLLRDARAHQRMYGPDGTTRDEALLGSDLAPGIAIGPDDTPSIAVSPVSPFVVGVVQHGVEPEVSLYVARLTELRGAATPWRKLAGPERGITGFDLRGESIYVVTNEGAPRYRVLRWSLADPRSFTPSAATVIVPESARVVRGVSVAKDALYVQQMDAGVGRLLRVRFDGTAPAVPPPPSARRKSAAPRAAPARRRDPGPYGEVRLPFPGAIDERITNPLHAGALLRMEGWTEPPGYFTVDAKSGAVTRTPLLPPARADFSGVASTQVRVRAHDGVEVPLSIVHAKGAMRDGSARVLLEAYGAYGNSEEPRFAPSLLAWIERGGVYAVAHVRGGGELGRDWHRAGFKATKANTWRDAIAAAEWLVRENWTRPARLAITGGSAGGIAAGNAVVDRPDLFAAMVSMVGFHDTLRGETGLVGPANVPEFGSVATEQGFRDLLAMSSYARLADGAAYPAALFTTGFNDPRVDAWDPAKAAARMQAISAGPGGSGKPVLLRVEFAGGHGGGTTTQRIDEQADVFAFLLWQTGAPGFALP
ncbi:MAG: prolyl oligopeptidase family serine peptidase [Burkholderiales bacterium]